MKKNEAIRMMGLTKFDRDIVWMKNKSSAVRDIYIDGRGDSWVWFKGQFCEVTEELMGNGYLMRGGER